MKNIGAHEAIVLVGVFKRKRDLNIFLKERWYRIPLLKAPRRKFRYLALYEPARFGRCGKRIRYYARVAKIFITKRRELLPDEKEHPGAADNYLRIQVGRVRQLAKPIRNVPVRRVSFGFTTLGRLLSAKTILGLYGVTPSEEIIGRALRRSGIRAISQCYISCAGKRYCSDFAIHCKRSSIDIECDNAKAHSGARQLVRDKIRDARLKECGWFVVRLREEAILSDVQSCVLAIRHVIKNLGGMIRR